MVRLHTFTSCTQYYVLGWATRYKPEISGPCKPLLHGQRFSNWLSHQILTGLTDRDTTTMTTAIIFILLSLKYREKGGISSNVIPVFLCVFQYRCNVIVKNSVIPLMLMEKLSWTVRQTQIYFIPIPQLVQNCITLRQFIDCEQLLLPVWGLGHFSGISFRYKYLTGIMKQKPGVIYIN